MPFRVYIPSTSISAYKAEAPWVCQRRARRYRMTYGNDINELGGNDGLSTSVVLQLEGSNHVVGVLCYQLN